MEVVGESKGLIFACAPKPLAAYVSQLVKAAEGKEGVMYILKGTIEVILDVVDYFGDLTHPWVEKEVRLILVAI